MTHWKFAHQWRDARPSLKRLTIALIQRETENVPLIRILMVFLHIPNPLKLAEGWLPILVVVNLDLPLLMMLVMEGFLIQVEGMRILVDVYSQE
jgi:hypothetical protein